MLTLQGQPFVFANRGAVYGNPADEEAFCKDLAESGDTKIRCALCMWNDFTLDVPSCRLRELLLGLNPENRETQFLLNGAEGCGCRKNQFYKIRPLCYTFYGSAFISVSFIAQRRRAAGRRKRCSSERSEEQYVGGTK